MLSNILNLEGVAVLNKNQQESIQGGQACKFTLVLKTGYVHRETVQGFEEGPAGSSQANSICSEFAQNTGSRCFYDCAWDD